MIVEKKPGIYLIFCLANQRVYIGQSKNVKARLGSHQTYLKGNKHPNEYLQNAYNKYGVDMFVFRPCEYPEDTSVENLTAREAYWIEQFDAMNPRRGFNLKEAGLAGRPGKETREKMSKIRKGKTSNRKGCAMSDEQKQKLREANLGKPGPNKGKKLSEETKAKLSAAQKGIPKGPMSEETKQKLSEVRKGKLLSDEHKEKLSLALTGKKLPPRTEEHKANIAAAKKGKAVLRTEEHNRKIGEARKGKKNPPITEETRAKMSEAQKRRYANS